LSKKLILRKKNSVSGHFMIPANPSCSPYSVLSIFYILKFLFLPVAYLLAFIISYEWEQDAE
jgi:hypothetical protein